MTVVVVVHHLVGVNDQPNPNYPTTLPQREAHSAGGEVQTWLKSLVLSHHLPMTFPSLWRGLAELYAR